MGRQVLDPTRPHSLSSLDAAAGRAGERGRMTGPRTLSPVDDQLALGGAATSPRNRADWRPLHDRPSRTASRPQFAAPLVV
jgi:hypothetical protein